MHKNTSFIIPNNNKNKNHYNDFSTKKTIVMGILNITEDSFYDGGKYNNTKSLIQQTKKMLDEGASIIDIGAAYTKHGHCGTIVNGDVDLSLCINMYFIKI